MNSSGSTAAERARKGQDFLDALNCLLAEVDPETPEEIDAVVRSLGIDPDAYAATMARLVADITSEVVGRFHAANQMEWHNALQTVPTIEHGWVLVAVRPHARDRYARAYVTIGAYSEWRGWRGKFGPIEGEVAYWMDLPAYPETADGQAYAIAVPAACHWQLCNETWVGDCGVLWEFADAGTPPEHRVNYCPRCGRGVVVEVPVEE